MHVISTPEPLAHEQLNSTDEGYYNKKRSGCQAILLKIFQKITENLPGGGLAGKRWGKAPELGWIFPVHTPRFLV